MSQSSRQKGNVRETRLGKMLEREGYYTFISRGSRGIDLIAIDDIAYPDATLSRPILCFEVGGKSKGIAGAFAELRQAKRPLGSLCLVARWLRPAGKRPHWRFHIDEDYFYDDLDSALDALKER